MKAPTMARIIEYLIPREVKRFEDDYGSVIQIEKTTSNSYILRDIKKDGTTNLMVFFDAVIVQTGYVVLMNRGCLVSGVFTEEYEVM